MKLDPETGRYHYEPAEAKVELEFQGQYFLELRAEWQRAGVPQHLIEQRWHAIRAEYVRYGEIAPADPWAAFEHCQWLGLDQTPRTGRAPRQFVAHAVRRLRPAHARRRRHRRRVARASSSSDPDDPAPARGRLDAPSRRAVCAATEQDRTPDDLRGASGWANPATTQTRPGQYVAISELASCAPQIGDCIEIVYGGRSEKGYNRYKIRHVSGKPGRSTGAGSKRRRPRTNQ